MGSLSNLYISQSYQSLIHLATNNTASATLIGLQDGLGNSIGVSINTAGDLYLSGSLTASLQQGYAWVGNANNVSALVPTSSFGGALPAGTISSSAQITALGFVSSSVTASSLITASFSGNTLTFTKGDSSTFGVVIPDISGSTINTGSFATTGSNTFIGDQTITGSLFISGNINMVNGADLVTHHVRAQGSNGLELQTAAGAIIVSMGAGGGTQAAFVGAVTANSISASTINGIGNVTNYSTSVDSRLDNLEAATSSYVTSAITASSLVTASVNLNTITFTKGDTTTFAITVNTGSGGGGSAISVQDEGSILGDATSFNFNGAGVTATLSAGTASITIPGGGGSIDTGSFATTGSNTFTGDQTLIDNAGNFFTISDASGSMMLVGKSYTSASAHLSASVPSPSGSQLNLIFKTNNNTADTIISGSNNIFTNLTAPTAGFKRYIGGNNNIYNGTLAAQISGTMAFPVTMNTNIGPGTFIMRGPNSSSAWTMSSNVIQGNVNMGNTPVQNAEKIVSGLTLSTNNIAGTLTIIANREFLTSSATVNTNTIGGTVTLNLNSSSVAFTNNIVADTGFSLTNNYYTSSLGLGVAQANRNLIIGSSNIMLATGISDFVGVTQPGFNNNILGGTSNTLFINATSASTNQQLTNTIIYGNTLIVTGSSNNSTTNGSAFFGRYNVNDGRRNSTAGTIFAVGTGTSSGAASRKTGFLIDSGSNTFVEGTFNVSGSSTFTGSVNVTGSLLVNGISATIPVGTVSSSTQIVAYGIFATTGSNSFNGNQRITGSLTISGSIITVDRSGNDGNTYMGQNALGMGFAGAQPLAVGNSISVAIGQGAMRFASGSNQNVAIGNNALLITTGSKNFAMGSEALSGNTTGASNIAIGTSALQNNTTGDSSTAIGDSAAQFASGSQNTFIGQYSGYNVTGSNNVIIGSYRGVAGQVISNNIILSDGQQNIRAQYSGSSWFMEAPVNFTTGSNQQAGTAVLDGANPGTVTVSNSLVTANSIIMLTKQTLTNAHMVAVTAKSGGSFTITSNGNGDTDTVGWFIINNS